MSFKTVLSLLVIRGVLNKPALIYKLVWNGTYWMPDTTDKWNNGKSIYYPDGKIYPDSEDLTMAESNSSDIYVCSEKDGATKVSQLAVFRYVDDPSSTSLVAASMWDLTKSLPAVDNNAGLEGITCKQNSNKYYNCS